MAKEKFLLVSLNESKTKELAQAISNESCRKILDYLAEREDATETDIASKLNIPISTVHYNIHQLQRGGLVNAEEFHYSQKGREVIHYKLANKYIIIAPKSTYGIKEKLKNIIPVALIIGAGAAIFKLFSGIFTRTTFGTMSEVKSAVAEKVSDQLLTTTANKVAEASPALAASPADVVSNITPAASNIATQAIQSAPSIWQSTLFWFVIGAASAVALYLIVEGIRNRKK
jgi:DNA-binding transcriptional ArsR family regulator